MNPIEILVDAVVKELKRRLRQDQGSRPVCQECDELRLGVPGLCLGEAGVGVGKRCKWLIIKPLEPARTD